MGKSKDFELKCPKCGNDGASSDSERRIQHFEWMPVFRVVEAVEGVTVYLDMDNYHDIPEAAKDPHFYCLSCKHEWAAPDDLTVDCVDNYEGKGIFSEMDK